MASHAPLAVLAKLMSVLLLVALVVAAHSVVANTGVPAERVAAAKRMSSQLRPDFVGTVDEQSQVATSSSSLQAHMEAHGEGDVFAASKFACPCSNQFCSASRWHFCSCNVKVCSC
ncbi:hypothetical protein GOP47_0003407, partial [Adiantum capillus-veneris]